MARIDKIRCKFNTSCMKGVNSVKSFARKEVVDKKNSLSVKLFYTLWSAMSAIMAVFGTMAMAFADNNDTTTIDGAVDGIASSFGDVATAIYNGVLAVASIVCAMVIAICLLIRMLSKNPRAAESATEWAKRAFFSLLILWLIKLLFVIGKAIATSAGATGNPWDA